LPRSPAPSFVTDAAAASRNSLLLTLGADYALASNVSLGLAADAAIGDASRAIAGRASFKVRW
jgi:outer membrane autotransporter protein